MTATFTIWENRLASRLGVSRDTLAALRKSGALTQGEDWEHSAGRVCYAERSVSKVMQHLGVCPTEPQSSPEMPQDASDPAGRGPDPSPAPNGQPALSPAAGEVAQSAQATELVTVVSRPNRRFNGAHYINPRLILARRDSGREICVAVRDSARFRPERRDGRPMQVRVYHDGYGWIAASGPL